MNKKEKVITINTANGLRYFFEWNVVGVNRLFILFYTHEAKNTKKLNASKYYLPKGIIQSYDIIINGRNLYDQAIVSHLKPYKEIRKLTTGQGEDYTTGCF